MCTYAESLATIGPVFAEIFGGIYRFVPIVKKGTVITLLNSGGVTGKCYWTDRDRICTVCSKNIAI